MKIVINDVMKKLTTAFLLDQNENVLLPLEFDSWHADVVIREGISGKLKMSTL